VAYPEKILADDERVVEHLHPHWITLVPATLWFLVIAAATGFGLTEIFDNMDSGTGRLVVVLIVVVVAFLLLCWLTFAPWIRWRTTHYVFTSHRVLIRRGVFTHSGRDISLQRISDVGSSTLPNTRAPVGHASRHAGSRPSRVRCRQNVHFSITPCGRTRLLR